MTDVKDPFFITGEEVKTTRGEILALFIEEEIPKGLSPEETLDRIEEQGGIAVIPHPFDVFRGKTALGLRWKIPENVLVEVKNARYVCKCFESLAREVAREKGLPMVGGSDAHTPWEVGRAYTIVPPFSDKEELYKHLKKGRAMPGGSYSLPFVHAFTLPLKSVNILKRYLLKV